MSRRGSPSNMQYGPPGAQQPAPSNQIPPPNMQYTGPVQDPPANAGMPPRFAPPQHPGIQPVYGFRPPPPPDWGMPQPGFGPYAPPHPFSQPGYHDPRVIRKFSARQMGSAEIHRHASYPPRDPANHGSHYSPLLTAAALPRLATLPESGAALPRRSDKTYRRSARRNHQGSREDSPLPERTRPHRPTKARRHTSSRTQPHAPADTQSQAERHGHQSRTHADRHKPAPSSRSTRHHRLPTKVEVTEDSRGGTNFRISPNMLGKVVLSVLPSRRDPRKKQIEVYIEDRHKSGRTQRSQPLAASTSSASPNAYFSAVEGQKSSTAGSRSSGSGHSSSHSQRKLRQPVSSSKRATPVVPEIVAESSKRRSHHATYSSGSESEVPLPRDKGKQRAN